MTLFHAITSTILFFVSSHLKIAIFLADWFDGNGYETHLLVLSSINERFFMDLQAYTRTDLFIINGSDLEYTRTITLTI